MSFMAFDYGAKRVGVATGNRITGTAQPLKSVPPDFAVIGKLVKEWQPEALVIGVPLHPDGAEHEITQRARKFGRQLSGRFHLPVHEVDERYTSVEAESLGASDVDSTAAALILEQFFREHSSS